jgi:sRNA-binding carbon storage regulator CsrA
MLCLVSYIGEPDNDVLIIVDGRIVAEIAPIECGRSRVKLGIEAPQDVEIFRRQVWDRVVAEGARGNREQSDDDDALCWHDLREQNRHLRQSLQNAAATIRKLRERLEKESNNGSET